MDAAASVSGTVTNTEGRPLAVVVFLWEEPEPGVYEAVEQFATANAEGRYTILESGRARPTSSSRDTSAAPKVVRRCTRRSSMRIRCRWRRATPLLLLPGEHREGINAVMIENGHISGRVVSAAIEHEPIAGAQVCAHPQAEPLGPMSCASANNNGEYTLVALPSGPYTVEFTGKVCPSKGECVATYARQYYSGKAVLAEATPVPVSVATTTPGINAALFELSPSAPANTAAPVLSGAAAAGGRAGVFAGVVGEQAHQARILVAARRRADRGAGGEHLSRAGRRRGAPGRMRRGREQQRRLGERHERLDRRPLVGGGSTRRGPPRGRARRHCHRQAALHERRIMRGHPAALRPAEAARRGRARQARATGA